MMGRVRNLSTNQRHVHLKTSPSNLPESPEAYLRFLRDCAEGDPLLIQHYDENGRAAYNIDDFESRLYITNQCEENRSRNRFARLFWDAITAMGSTVKTISDKDQQMNEALAEMTHAMTQDEYGYVAAALDLFV